MNSRRHLGLDRQRPVLLDRGSPGTPSTTTCTPSRSRGRPARLVRSARDRSLTEGRRGAGAGAAPGPGMFGFASAFCATSARPVRKRARRRAERSGAGPRRQPTPARGRGSGRDGAGTHRPSMPRVRGHCGAHERRRSAVLTSGRGLPQTRTPAVTEPTIRVRRIHRRDLNKVWSSSSACSARSTARPSSTSAPAPRPGFLEIYEEEGIEHCCSRSTRATPR